MLYEKMWEAALAVIKTHNTAVGVGADNTPNQGFVDPQQFKTCITVMGGMDAQSLNGISYEQILPCLPNVQTPNGTIKPMVLAQRIAQTWRQMYKAEGGPVTDDEKRPVSCKKADRMTPRELVESFDPTEDSSPVARRLAAMSKGEPFIVFESGRKVDVETTLKLLLEIKDSGMKGRPNYEVGGKIKRTYKVGQLPNNEVDENPLYPGRPLRPDGTCDQTQRSWEGVPLEFRQLVYMAVGTGELVVTLENAHNILDIVLGTNAEKTLRQRYRQAAMQFDESPKDRPDLRIRLNEESVGGSNGPFDNGKKVVWAARPDGRSYSGTSTSDIARRNR